MAQPPQDKHITYQLQYRKCGKPNCGTCRTGRGHGLYWYAYWYEGPRLRSSYIGRSLARQSASARRGKALTDLARRAAFPAAGGLAAASLNDTHISFPCVARGRGLLARTTRITKRGRVPNC